MGATPASIAIREEHLTIQTNPFGANDLSVVGLHAFHVTVGMIALALALVLAMFGQVKRENTENLEVLSIY